jgi:hypothetical protein
MLESHTLLVVIPAHAGILHPDIYEIPGHARDDQKRRSFAYAQDDTVRYAECKRSISNT